MLQINQEERYKIFRDQGNPFTISHVKISSNIREMDEGAIQDAVPKNAGCKGNFQYANSWRVRTLEKF